MTWSPNKPDFTVYDGFSTPCFSGAFDSKNERRTSRKAVVVVVVVVVFVVAVLTITRIL